MTSSSDSCFSKSSSLGPFEVAGRSSGTQPLHSPTDCSHRGSSIIIPRGETNRPNLWVSAQVDSSSAQSKQGVVQIVNPGLEARVADDLRDAERERVGLVLPL